MLFSALRFIDRNTSQGDDRISEQKPKAFPNSRDNAK